jgi:sulfur carrier protein
MTVNGEKTQLEHACTIEKFLYENGFRRDRIAIELNGSILPHEEYDKRMLSDLDQLEIVQFVGGG